MLTRLRNHVWGPADKAIAAVVGLALLAGLFGLYVALRPDECDAGLQKEGGECVGVTEYAFDTDPEIAGLIQAVADENARVKKGWEDPGDKSRVPYVRIALMMPFTADATSAMTMEQIRLSLAGAHTAQLQANASSGPYYQLLLANDGKDLDQWGPVVDKLSSMVDKQSPLVGVIGMPSSTAETLKAIKYLTEKEIPSVGPVITSSDMNAKYFFKTSPSNGLLAQALKSHLKEIPGDSKGFLVYDNRDQDVYSTNLRQVFDNTFGKQYGLLERRASYIGVTGDEAGIPRRFSSAAQNICTTHADTVFFAGRDMDLPSLVRQLAADPSCDRSQPIRILKVGIGLDPPLTTPELTRQMKHAKITLVAAASVDPQWWEQEQQRLRSPGLTGFLEQFRILEGEPKPGERPLDDGYAIMYHDAFTVLAQAVDQAYDDVNDNDRKGSAEPVMPSKDDVYNTMVNMSIRIKADGSSSCINCIRGASGTFGFDDSQRTQRWPVCKPVPVIEYPAPSGDEAGKRPLLRTFRTYEDHYSNGCP